MQRCRKEPHLQPVTSEIMNYKTANTDDESRLDIKAHGFWQRNQTTYFDIRVTHVNCHSQKDKETSVIFKTHEAEKKRAYLQRVVDIELGSFTPLIFGTNGGVGNECERFLSELATKISRKNDEQYSDTITWLRTRLAFEAIRSAVMCVRGSRVPFKRHEQEFVDFRLMNFENEIN